MEARPTRNKESWLGTYITWETIEHQKIIKITLIIGIAVIIAAFLVFYRPVSLAGDTQYEPVYTGSMEPAIPVGSLVVI